VPQLPLALTVYEHEQVPLRHVQPGSQSLATLQIVAQVAPLQRNPSHCPAPVHERGPHEPLLHRLPELQSSVV
jgi:hypothetical protein